MHSHTSIWCSWSPYTLFQDFQSFVSIWSYLGWMELMFYFSASKFFVNSDYLSYDRTRYFSCSNEFIGHYLTILPLLQVVHLLQEKSLCARHVSSRFFMLLLYIVLFHLVLLLHACFTVWTLCPHILHYAFTLLFCCSWQHQTKLKIYLNCLQNWADLSV